MVQITAEQAMEDLTMALLYLSRFKEGRDFGAENLYRAKSVSLSDEGVKRGKEIPRRYGISDWKKDE